MKRETLSRVAGEIDAVYANTSLTLKCAILAPFNLAYGLSRMYEMGEEHKNIEVMVFRELDKALQWLGISDSAFSEELFGLRSESSSAVFQITE